jgi:hypothetical protein
MRNVQQDYLNQMSPAVCVWPSSMVLYVSLGPALSNESNAPQDNWPERATRMAVAARLQVFPASFRENGQGNRILSDMEDLQKIIGIEGSFEALALDATFK